MRMPMKNRNATLLNGALGLVVSGAVAWLPPAARAAEFSLLFTGDSHSHLDATGPKDDDLRGTIGGLTKASSVIAGIEANDPDALFVHAGDLFNGDLYFPATLGPDGAPMLAVPEMQILADLGLDVLAVGNHEFGAGSGALAATLWTAFGGTGPAVLTANVDLTKAGLDGLVVPRTIIEDVDGIDVGFFGLTIVDWMSMGAPFEPESYSAEGLIGLAAEEAYMLQMEGADVVVCVAHLGLGLETAIATYAPGIDVVIGGHDHVHLDDPLLVSNVDGRDVPVVKAGQFYEYVGYLQVSYDEVTGEVAFPGHTLVHVDEAVDRLPEVDAVVTALQAGISAYYGEDFWGDEIGYAKEDVTRDVEPPYRDTGIGNLITDALREAGGTDIGVTAEGFFTEGLYAGPLVGDDAFRIVGNGIDPTAGPGYALYRAEITGENLLNALETSIELMGTAAGQDFFLQVSGMRFWFDPTLAERPRVEMAWVGGPPLDPDEVYTITLNYGNLLGLSLFPDVEFVDEPELIEGVDEYAAVRDFIESEEKLKYGPEGRSVDLSLRGGDESSDDDSSE